MSSNTFTRPLPSRKIHNEEFKLELNNHDRDAYNLKGDVNNISNKDTLLNSFL